MRLLPRSLFSRLVLVLLAGLTIAQLLSLAIHLRERGELVLQASGRESAQRIADIVRLLDPADPAGRRQMVKVLDAAPMRVSLDQGPIAPTGNDDAGSARGAAFGALLRQLLGDGWTVVTAIAESTPVAMPLRRGPGSGASGPLHGAHGRPHAGPPGWSDGGPLRGGMHAPSQAGLLFVAQVRLHDGTLVTLDARQAEPAPGWPLRMLLSLAVLLTAVLVLSLVAVRWATQPLKALADAADELGRNIHRPPMPESGPTEVARAARAFNTMQSRLAANLRERTSVLAAMSHDLKTPVTRLRLRAELLDDPQLRQKFSRDLEELEAMVTATLDFLRGTAGAEPVQSVDMGALLESLQSDLAETGHPVHIESHAARPYPGQPTALKRCVRNLLENAVNYGHSATVAVDDNAQRLQISIRDKGPGIPHADLERVFEPFERLEASRNRDSGGTGLGLTIARSIAQAHGGGLTLHNRAGGGLEARLVLPRVAGPGAASGQGAPAPDTGRT